MHPCKFCGLSFKWPCRSLTDFNENPKFNMPFVVENKKKKKKKKSMFLAEKKKVTYSKLQYLPYNIQLSISKQCRLRQNCSLKEQFEYDEFDIFQIVIFCLSLYTEEVNMQTFVII